MAVDDGVDLVGPGRRLVDALAVDGDDPLVFAKEFVERCDSRAQAVDRGDAVEVEGARLAQRRLEAAGMRFDEVSSTAPVRSR